MSLTRAADRPAGRVAAVRISERVDNAVRAMAELAAADGSSAKAEAIATSQGISLKFLLDIFRDTADYWAERKIPFRCFYSFL